MRNPLVIPDALAVLFVAVPLVYFIISAAMVIYVRSELRHDRWWTWVSFNTWSAAIVGDIVSLATRLERSDPIQT